jgi:endonuclease I
MGFSETRRNKMTVFQWLKRLGLALVFVLCASILFSQQPTVPNGYYDGTETLTGAPLKTALYNIIKGHNNIGYSGLWGAYKTTDKLVIGSISYVYDMYSVKSDSSASYYFTHTTDQCGNYSGEGDCYNREHSFPKSWFNDASPMYSDLFHIVPTDGYVNGKRSNYPFGEVASPTWTSTNGSKLGACSYPGYTGTVFEPIDEYKGDFARIYFYMATRYEDVIAGWPGSEMTNGTSFPCFSTWALSMLIEWNIQDPISEKEINRNEAVYLFQNNRNPFVDHPEFVASIWGGNSPSKISNISIQPITPKATDPVWVSATIIDAEGIQTVSMKWGTNSGNLNNTIAMTTAGNNLFATQTAIPAQNAGTMVYYSIQVMDVEAALVSSPVNSYTVLSNSPSVITDIYTQPAVPKAIDPVWVSATITDVEGIQAVSLKWGTNSGNLSNSIAMTTAGNNLYTTQDAIPAQSAGVSVHYAVQVTDAENVIKTGTIYSYTIQQVLEPVVLLNENFETATFNQDISINGWINFNETGSKKWKGTGSADNLYAQATSYGSGTENSIWLVSPTLNLAAYSDEVFSFDINVGYWVGKGLSVLISENFDRTNILGATWKEVTADFLIPETPTNSYGTLQPAGMLNLDSYSSYITFAFKYTGNSSSGINQTTTYQIDNVKVTGLGGPDILSPALSVRPANLTNELPINSSVAISSNEPLKNANGSSLDVNYIKSVISFKSNVGGTSYSVQIGDDQQQLVLIPDGDLNYNTDYTVTISSKAFADAAGNKTLGLQSGFTTIANPNSLIEVAENEWMFFPNPCKGIVTLAMGNHKVHYIKTQVYSPEGKLLKQLDWVNPSVNLILEISDLGKGIYFLKLFIDNEVVIRKVVVE